MRLKFKKVNKIFGLAYGGTAEAEVRTGSGIAQIVIDVRGKDDQNNVINTMKDDQVKFTLELNGDPILPGLSGKELNVFRLFDKEKVVDGVYVLNFFDFVAKSIAGEEEGALPTNGSDTLILKVDAGMRRAGQPEIPALKIRVKYVDLYDPDSLGSGKTPKLLTRLNSTPIRVWRRKTLTTNSSGEIEWPVTDGKPLVRRTAMTGPVSALSVKINGRDQMDEITKEELEMDQEFFGKAPQAGVVMFDPGMTGRKQVDRLDSALLDLEINPHASEPGTIQVLMENFETGRGKV